MKKLVALLLGGAMCATAIAGIAGCKPKTPAVEGREDPRAADAYTAYDYEGNVVGGYKTIADAITAVVDADLDFMEDEATEDGAEGGYVTKKDGSMHLFTNKKGVGDGTDDQYWYYQDGNKLAGYSGWDGDAAIDHLRNQKVTVNKVSDMGLTSLQSWNGFGLLNEVGQEDTTSNTPASWALSTAIDAGLIVFPSSMGGVQGTGMTRNTYDLDLSEVRITPPYEGEEDSVYAFIGFYLWHSQYVLAVGVGCDTSTGKWYEFQGTSRDDSFSDLEYNIGDCIMESTWNNDGYFTPNASEMQMKVETVKYYDEEFDENYYSIKLSVTLDGEEALAREYDDDYLHIYSSWDGIAANNDYMFIAGLDVKNKVVSGAKVGNVDYFNGAKFENLCVTGAKIYFPTEEEFDNDDLGFELNPDLRGTEQDFLLANSETASGAYAYTILSNYACTSYEGRDSVDYYSFHFDGDPVGETEIGGQLKEYQDAIDSLREMTVDNVQDYLETYEEVTGWYGKDKDHAESTLKPIHLNLLDFTAYEEARSVYEDSMKLTDAGKAVRDDLDALGLFAAPNAAYPYGGWTANGSPAEGKRYVWDDALKFHEINERFLALDPEEQSKIIKLSAGGQDAYDTWDLLYTTVKEYLDNTTYTSKSYTISKMGMSTTLATVTYTGEQALQTLFDVAFQIYSGEYHNDSRAVPIGTIDTDDNRNFYRAFHLLFLMNKMKDEGVEIPEGFTDTVYAQITSAARPQACADDINNYIYPVLTLAGDIYARQQRGEFVWLDAEMAEIINDHMVGFENFGDTGFAWNYANNKDLRDTNQYYEQYFGLPNAAGFFDSLKYVTDVVELCDDKAELNSKKLGYVADVIPLEQDPSQNGSDEAKAVVAKILALAKFEGYDYKGWTTENEDKTGYLYDTLKAFRTLVGERKELGLIDKAYVSAQIANAKLSSDQETAAKGNYEAWEAFSAEIAALEETETDFWTKQFTTLEAGYNKTNSVTLTGEQVLANIYEVVSLVKSGKVISNASFYGEKGAADQTTLTKTPDNTFYTAMWVARMVCFTLDCDVTLPADLTAGLTAIDYFTFYTQTYYPIMGTLRIAERIGKIGEDQIKKMEDFTDEEIAFLNEVWTDGYEQKGSLKTHWNGDGNKLSGWWQERSPKFVQDMGGTLKTDETNTRVKSYVEILSNFLEQNHYTIKANGWGTTAKEILGVSLSEDALALVAEFEKIGNLDVYDAKGWKAPDEAQDIKGYLYSEANYYKTTIKPMIDALDDDAAETVSLLVGIKNFEDWETLSEQILAFDAEKAEIEFDAADSDAQDAKSTTYTVGEALGELLEAIAKAAASGEKLGFDSGIDKGVSFRPYFFYFTLEGLDVEIPSVITDRMDAVKMDEAAAAKFEEDVKYIMTIMTIAKAISGEEGTDHKLTQDEIDMINANLVGKEKFVDGGFSYAYTVDTPTFGEPVSWHHKSKGYKRYFGFDTSKSFDYYQKLVINYLVEKYNATALKYNDTGKNPPADCVMGIAAEIVAQD